MWDILLTIVILIGAGGAFYLYERWRHGIPVRRRQPLPPRTFIKNTFDMYLPDDELTDAQRERRRAVEAVVQKNIREQLGKIRGNLR